VTGFLVEHRDEPAIAGRICELLASFEKRAEMGRLGRERVRQEFRLDRFLELHAALYEGRLPD